MKYSRDDLEIIVGDNNSDGSARSIVERFDDPRIKYLTYGRNVGPLENIYNLVAAASGEWVLCLTDDDFVLPGGIARILEVARREHSVGVVMGPLECRNEEGAFIHTYHAALVSGRIRSGFAALTTLVPAAHVLSSITFRKRWSLDVEMRRHFESLYPQMYLVGEILKHHDGFYLDDSVVCHTEGNQVYWEYSKDYMFESRRRLVNDLLPGYDWRDAREELVRILVEEVARSHIPHAFKHSFWRGIEHQFRVIRNIHIIASVHYWLALSGMLRSFASRRMTRWLDRSRARTES